MTSAPTAAIQVYDGDGLSESERETLSRLASERAVWAEVPKVRKLKARWSVEAMEDFKNVRFPDFGPADRIAHILTKKAVDEMVNEAFLPSSMTLEAVKKITEQLGVPRNLLIATK